MVRKRPEHLLDARRRVHDQDQQLRRHVADAEEHPLLVDAEVIQDLHGVGCVCLVLVDPPRERPVVHHADRRCKLRVALDPLGALLAQPLEERVHLRRLLGVLADEKDQRLRQLRPCLEPREEIRAVGRIGLAHLPYETQRESGLAESIGVAEVCGQGHLRQIVLERRLRGLEVAPADEHRQECAGQPEHEGEYAATPPPAPVMPRGS
jgi:hypothetical protein